MTTQAFDIYLKSKLIDTVFYDAETSKDKVKRGLVNHDGYDENIIVRKRRSEVNKYIYGWKFYINYGQGWEYENFEETYKMMKENAKAYKENCPYPLRITRGRELNPSYIGA